MAEIIKISTKSSFSSWDEVSAFKENYGKNFFGLKLGKTTTLKNRFKENASPPNLNENLK